MENWGKKIFWVVQEPVYRNFETRYNLQNLGFQSAHSTVFALYDLKSSGETFNLAANRKTSASMDQLFGAFRNNPNIPSITKFHGTLKRKLETDAHISLHLGSSAKVSVIDVKPPTASGKVRDDPAEYSKTDLFEDE